MPGFRGLTSARAQSNEFDIIDDDIKDFADRQLLTEMSKGRLVI